MSKTKLIAVVTSETAAPRRIVLKTVDSFLAHLTGAIAQHGKVTLSGFGSFQVRYRQARPGRNPKTGEAILIPPSRTVAFRPAKALRKAIS